MKNKILMILFTSMMAFLMIITACETKPTEPRNDNPFDRLNPQTNGDPFQLTGKIDNGGITLSWTIPRYDLDKFRIYRSEQESFGYSPIGEVEKERNYFVDKFIQNGHNYWYRIVAVNNNVESAITNTAGVNINSEPLLLINGGNEYTTTREVQLTILAYTAKEIILSNDPEFTNADWRDYETSVNRTLENGPGEKTVYMKVKYDSTESNVVSASILPKEVSNFSLSISNSDTTDSFDVPLNIMAQNAVKMIIANDSLFSGNEWEDYATSKSWHLDYTEMTDNKATVYIKFKNTFEMESNTTKDEIYINIISGIKINNNSEYTSSRNVVLTLSSIFEHEMILSYNANFSGAQWEPFSGTKNWILPKGAGPFIVYAKFRDPSGFVSKVFSDTIKVQPLDPSIVLAQGVKYSNDRNIQILLSALGENIRVKLSEDSTFSGIDWQSYSSNMNFQLSSAEGAKKVFAKFINNFDVESNIVNDAIILDTTPPIIALSISPDSGITNETEFQIDPTSSNDNITPAGDLLVRYDYENDGTFDTEWKKLEVGSKKWEVGGGDKTIKMLLKDGAAWQVDTTVNIFINTRPIASFNAVKDDSQDKLFHFDASVSSDYEDGQNIEYRWDFDGDGAWDTQWLTQDTTHYEYAEGGVYSAKLSVRDQYLLTAETTKQISTILESTMTDIDGNVYNTIKIGNQWWMTENLKVTHYRNGELIFDLLDQSAWSDSLWPGYCYYDNNSDNITVYGLLYNWFVVNDARNVAPEGWHVPSDEEWKELEMYLGMSQAEADQTGSRGTDEGDKLKSESGWNNNGNGSNESGFSAIPGGERYHNGSYFDSGNCALFWTSTEAENYTAWYRELCYDDAVINRGTITTIRGFSIRLVKD